MKNRLPRKLKKRMKIRQEAMKMVQVAMVRRLGLAQLQMLNAQPVRHIVDIPLKAAKAAQVVINTKIAIEKVRAQKFKIPA